MPPIPTRAGARRRIATLSSWPPDARAVRAFSVKGQDAVPRFATTAKYATVLQNFTSLKRSFFKEASENQSESLYTLALNENSLRLLEIHSDLGGLQFFLSGIRNEKWFPRTFRFEFLFQFSGVMAPESDLRCSTRPALVRLRVDDQLQKYSA